MKKVSYISSKSNIMGGAPVVTGTRIPVAVIIQRLKEGYTVEAIHQGYPWVPLTVIKGAINELVMSLSESRHASETI